MLTTTRKLPVGVQDFEKLRRGNNIYVDKTAYLYQLVNTDAPYFLGRPRRFGKSL
ncbi:MAG: AAA family ATPase, partial [Planctomycetaceae bacterium]|nr:AAA family ATPase [Planctomycetaceae bacterium]